LKTEIENVSDVKKILHFEIPWEDIDKHVKQALRIVSKNAKVPGFRQGKAPVQVIRTRFAEQIKDEVIHKVIPEALKDAVEQNELKTISDPRVHDILYNEGSPFVFKVTLEVKPKIEMKEYKGIPLKTLPVEVKDLEVEAMLKNYQQRAAELIPLESTVAEDGHYLAIHVRATLDKGNQKQKLYDDHTMIQVGSEENHAAFNENLRGKTTGDTVEFDASYADDYGEKSIAGKTIHYTVKVEAVNERRLPSIDDEFAKDLGEFGSLDDLRDKIRKDIAQMKENQQREQLKDQALGKLIDDNPFEVPESMIKAEAESLAKQYAYTLVQRGTSLDDPNLKWDEIYARLSKQAEHSVRGALLLETVARREEIKVTEEDLDHRIQMMSEHEKKVPEALKAELLKDGERMERLRNRILMTKTADFIIDHAKTEYIGKESEKQNENS